MISLGILYHFLRISLDKQQNMMGHNITQKIVQWIKQFAQNLHDVRNSLHKIEL